MKEKLLKPKIIISAVLALLILLLAFFFFQYQKTQNELSKIKSQNQLITDKESEVKKLVEEVSKIMALPLDQTPTVATVNDVEKLRLTQPFFMLAKNGDKVLVYQTRAILYDPIAKKIVDVSRLSQSSPSAQIAAPSAPEPVQTPPPTPTPTQTDNISSKSFNFAIYNSTKTTGLAKTYETEVLKKLTPSSVVVKKADAKGDYSKSIIIDINKSKSKEVEQISGILNLETTTFPENEVKPTGVDFLIILGSDKENL